MPTTQYLQKQIDYLEGRIGLMDLRVKNAKKKVGFDDPLETLESHLDDLQKGLSKYESELAELSE